MAVTLYGQVRINRYGTGRGHPAQIVPRQIHQHDVFRQFLGIIEQALLKAPVFLRVAPPGPSAGDGPQRGPAMAQLDQRLGR